jgi:hypothetical protein
MLETGEQSAAGIGGAPTNLHLPPCGETLILRIRTWQRPLFTGHFNVSEPGEQWLARLRSS